MAQPNFLRRRRYSDIAELEASRAVDLDVERTGLRLIRVDRAARDFLVGDGHYSVVDDGDGAARQRDVERLPLAGYRPATNRPLL